MIHDAVPSLCMTLEGHASMVGCIVWLLWSCIALTLGTPKQWALFYLALYPGFLMMFGRKSEPGDYMYCIAHIIFPSLSVVLRYGWHKLMSERLFATMAISCVSCTSSSQTLTMVCAIRFVTAGAIRCEDEERAEAANLRGVRRKNMSLFAKWLRQKCLLSSTSFPLRPQPWSGRC